MEGLFASGLIIDLILVGVAVEALLLAAIRYRLGAGPSLAGLIANLAAGAALMLALRAALTGEAWPVVSAFMLAGLFAHGLDLVLRFRRSDRRPFAAGGRPQEQAVRDPRSRAATRS